MTPAVCAVAVVTRSTARHDRRALGTVRSSCGGRGSTRSRTELHRAMRNGPSLRRRFRASASTDASRRVTSARRACSASAGGSPAAAGPRPKRGRDSLVSATRRAAAATWAAWASRALLRFLTPADRGQAEDDSGDDRDQEHRSEREHGAPPPRRQLAQQETREIEQSWNRVVAVGRCGRHTGPQRVRRRGDQGKFQLRGPSRRSVPDLQGFCSGAPRAPGTRRGRG